MIPFTREQIGGENIVVGDHTYGLPEVSTWGENSKLVIGKYCSIAKGVEIYMGGNHHIEWVTTYPFSAVEFQDLYPEAYENIGNQPVSKGDVIIGNDVWIGRGATILSGVNIGNGAVIGAKAVIAKDVPAYAVVVGNPSKVIKYRFNNKQIKKLEEISWWNWDDEKVKENIHLLCSEKIDDFIKNHS